MSIIQTTNHGPLIVASTYFGSDLERAGKLWCSVSAGTIRVMIPASLRRMIDECRGARYVILSRGLSAELGSPEAIELLFEDHTDTPFAIHLTADSFDMLPGEPIDGQWVLTMWHLKKGRPHMALTRPVKWRRVERIPWLKPWEG